MDGEEAARCDSCRGAQRKNLKFDQTVPLALAPKGAKTYRDRI
jgi:hypothetical protein